MPGVHDLGGVDGFGPIPNVVDGPAFTEPWEGRVWAMSRTVMERTTVDRFRSTIERMASAEYLSSSYYERWLYAIEHLAEEQGLLRGRPTQPQLQRPTVAPPPAAGRFASGDTVRAVTPTGTHTRVPGYLHGAVGRVERIACLWPDPTWSAATGTYAEPVTVYAVAFAAADLFPAPAGTRPPSHTVIADLVESALMAG
jgi:hypothetical protein